MEIASLGIRTDIALLRRQGSVVEDHADHLVVRTPDNPGYWWGNCLVLAAKPPDLAPWRARFAELFPDSRHIAIAIDGRDGAPGLTADDMEVERLVVLTATALRAPPHADAVAECRLLAGDTDWAQLRWLQEVNFDMEPTAAQAEFVGRRAVRLREMCEAGDGVWAGAFVDGMLRGSLGLASAGEGVARYQAVDTHPAFRRRGLAGTLLAFGASAARERFGPIERLVIVAELDGDAARLYRAMGFVEAERQVQVFRGGVTLAHSPAAGRRAPGGEVRVPR